MENAQIYTKSVYEQVADVRHCVRQHLTEVKANIFQVENRMECDDIYSHDRDNHLTSVSRLPL